MDNAPYHASDISRRFYASYKLTIAFTAPYAYESSPVETVFSILKRGELNEDNIRMTGKSFEELNKIVMKKLAKIPRE